MTASLPLDRTMTARWVRSLLVVFLALGLGFGTWLSRLPAIRDQLDATAVEMSIYGLCLALGSLVGLSFSGRVVHRFTPRSTLYVCLAISVVTLPGAAAIIVGGAIPVGLAVLFAYGIVFSIADVAANVSGANAENVFGRPRMPLMHAGYSAGTVLSTGVGSLAEAFDVPVALHFAVIMAISAVAVFPLIRHLPRDEQAVRLAAEGLDPYDAAVIAADEEHSSLEETFTGPIPIIDSSAGQQPAFTPMTGSIPIITSAHASEPAAADPSPASTPAAGAAPTRSYSPWRDPRIVVLGVTTLAIGLIEGTAADWLPMALVDGRGVTNQFGSMLLSIFFASIMLVRIAGSWLIFRFGRVTVLRASAVCAVIGLLLAILVPSPVGLFVGVVLWGAGAGIGWPLTISASADRAETAARDVATVSALGYGAMLVGPMAFGFLGEHIGLLNAFWALLPFAVFVLIAAGVARPLRGR